MPDDGDGDPNDDLHGGLQDNSDSALNGPDSSTGSGPSPRPMSGFTRLVPQAGTIPRVSSDFYILCSHTCACVYSGTHSPVVMLTVTFGLHFLRMLLQYHPSTPRPFHPFKYEI